VQVWYKLLIFVSYEQLRLFADYIESGSGSGTDLLRCYIVIRPHTLWFKKVALTFAVTLVNVLNFSVVFKNRHTIELRKPPCTKLLHRTVVGKMCIQ